MKNILCININKGKKKHKLKYYLIYYELLPFILKIVAVSNLVNKSIRKLNNYYSEIHLVVQGNGTQRILGSSFNINPSEVLVNGIKDDSCVKTCKLTGNINNITIRFETQIDSCENMFRELKSIIEINLSNFDASKVKRMTYMFYLCSNLEKINFGNINTSSVENMRSLFSWCIKLTSIINLFNFDTSSTTNMHYMFCHCESLKYLDLSNFDTSKIITVESMFEGCYSLLYLNLYSFKLSKTVIKNFFFWGVSSNIKYCINDLETELFLFNNKQKSNCSDICFNKNIIFDEVNNKCIIDSCSKNENLFIFNGKCYLICPQDTFTIFNNSNNINHIKINCYDKPPKGYYLDSQNQTYKKCYNSCQYCYGEGNETMNNCKECISNYLFLNEMEYKTNCYQKCDYFYYLDESNKYHCNETCPEK